MPQEWITDRPPTEADGDMDGDVLIRRAPIARFIHWSFVPPGMDWQHTSFRRPPVEARAEPAPAEPDRIAALEQRVVRRILDLEERASGGINDRIAALEERMAGRIAALEQQVAELEATMRQLMNSNLRLVVEPRQ